MRAVQYVCSEAVSSASSRSADELDAKSVRPALRSHLRTFKSMLRRCSGEDVENAFLLLCDLEEEALDAGELLLIAEPRTRPMFGESGTRGGTAQPNNLRFIAAFGLGRLHKFNVSIKQ